MTERPEHRRSRVDGDAPMVDVSDAESPVVADRYRAMVTPSGET